MLIVPPNVGVPAFDSDGFLPGTLASIQPSHLTSGFSDVPANGASIENAAWRSFCKTTGRPASAKADGNITFVSSGVGTNKMSVSRTSKGGVAFLPSQVNGDLTAGAYFKLSDAIKQHVLDTTTQFGAGGGHTFAWVVWMIPLRNAVSGWTLNTPIAAVTARQQNPFLRMAAEGDNVGANDQQLRDYNYPSGFFPIDTPTVRICGSNGWANSGKPPNIGAFEIFVGAGMTPEIVNASGYVNKSGGFALFRADFVNLTLSGLDNTFTGMRTEFLPAVTALDVEQLRIAARRIKDHEFGPNGRWFNDARTVAPGGFP
jgi:hypothetical protein